MTEVVILDAVSKHVVSRGQHRAGDREDGFLGAAAALDSEELHAEVAILFPGGRPGRIGQRGFEPGRTPTRACRPPLAGTFIESGAQTGPRDEMADGGKPRHVDADFGDEHPGSRVAQAGHRRQEVDGGAKGTERVSDARFDGRDRGIQGVDLREMQLDQEPMMIGDASVQGVNEVGVCRFQPAPRQVCETLGIRLPGDECGQYRAPTRTQDVRHDPG